MNCSDCTVSDNLQRLYCIPNDRIAQKEQFGNSFCLSCARVSIFRNAQPSDMSSAFGYNLCRDERRSVLQAASCYLYGAVQT